MRRLGGVVGTVFMCLVAGLVGSALTRQFGTSSYTLSYADFVSILLTAVTLLMTLLGFFIAMLALIGWNSISGKVAADVSRFLAEGFKDGEPLHRMLVDQTNRAMYSGVHLVDSDLPDDDAEGLPSQDAPAQR